MQTLLLNGEWKLTYQTLKKPAECWGRWISASVPGDVHLDLMRAGLISEPLVGLNSTRYRWIEEKDWLYYRRFEVQEAFIGQKVELVCDGLDLTADLWLNGELIGSANNMFRQHRFDITRQVRPGTNELRLRLDVGFEAVQGKPTEKFAKAWGREEPRRPWMRKAQQAFYWDVAPRLVTCGIWRDIYLESFQEVAFRDVHITSTFHEQQAQIYLALDVEALADLTENYWVEVKIKDETTELFNRFPVILKRGNNTPSVLVLLDHPRLWWPNGMGDQSLYTITIRLLSHDTQRCLGEKTLRHGIRTITVVQDPLNETEKTFTVVVNGCKVFCKGGNWVPSDAIYARINREKEVKLLTYARDANFNMIRVWGGGVYPDPFFYDLCDELGLMVWQDFMYACAYYPDDEPEFCEEARLEAEWAVRKFRNHASLALWCGNNETYWMHNQVNPGGTFYGFKLYHQIIPAVIQQLDGVTYYHPGSPYPGAVARHEAEGDQHVWSYALGWYENIKRAKNWDLPAEANGDAMRIWDMAEHNHKFVSEFGLWCPSNPASLQKYMGEYPAVTSGEVYQHHRNYFEADFILEALRRYYKRRDSYSEEEFVIAGQMLQAEVMKHLLEEFRSRMYQCSGTLFWEYNDTWGHVGYAPVDYYLNIRPLYFYMQRAFAPLHVVFKEQGNQVWMLNDLLSRRVVTLQYGYMRFSGEAISESTKTVVLEPCSALLIDCLQGGATIDRRATFAYARVFDQEGRQIDRNRAFLAPLQELSLPDSSMDCQLARIDQQTWEVTVAAEQFVWMVKIDADENLQCSDNAFDLWPGEKKTVTVRAETADPYLELRVNNINQYFNR